MGNNVYQAIIGTFYLILILLFLILIKSYITKSNTYSYPDDLECKWLDQFMEIRNHISVTDNVDSIWNFQIDIDGLDKLNGKLQMTCPSFNTDSNDAQIIVDGNLILSSKVLDWNEFNMSSQSYYITDCHDNPVYFINTTFKQNNPIFKDFNLKNQIWSSDSSIFYGYVVQEQNMKNQLDFDIIDENKNLLAKISKDTTKLKWNIDIIDIKHPAARPSLVLLLIAKLEFNREDDTLHNSNDLCNDFYSYINIFYYVYLVISPIMLVFLVLSALKPDNIDDEIQNDPNVSSQNVQLPSQSILVEESLVVDQ